jgi:hypothetical protein
LLERRNDISDVTSLHTPFYEPLLSNPQKISVTRGLSATPGWFERFATTRLGSFPGWKRHDFATGPENIGREKFWNTLESSNAERGDQEIRSLFSPLHRLRDATIKEECKSDYPQVFDNMLKPPDLKRTPVPPFTTERGGAPSDKRSDGHFLTLSPDEKLRF